MDKQVRCKQGSCAGILKNVCEENMEDKGNKENKETCSTQLVWECEDDGRFQIFPSAFIERRRGMIIFSG